MQDVARHVHDLQQAAFEKDQVRQCLNVVIGKVVMNLKPWTLGAEQSQRAIVLHE